MGAWDRPGWQQAPWRLRAHGRSGARVRDRRPGLARMRRGMMDLMACAAVGQVAHGVAERPDRGPKRRLCNRLTEAQHCFAQPPEGLAKFNAGAHVGQRCNLE